MKFTALTSLTLLLASSSPADSLFDYIAYTQNGIKAECSDYLGKTASAGAIELGDFLIRAHTPSNACPLASRIRVTMVRGGVQKSNEDWACIASAKVEGSGTYSRQVRGVAIPYSALTNEMNQASVSLAATVTHSDIVIMNLNANQLSHTTITLSATANQTLVINVRGKEATIQGTGVKLIGGVSPSSVIWNFIDAEKITLRHAGVNPAEYGKNVGMPGTFLAPLATVYFNDALITGALYSNRIIGRSDSLSCGGSNGGQINPACFNGRSLGIGCSDDQRQQPDQRQEP